MQAERQADCDFSLSIHYNASNNNGDFDDANGISAMVDNETPTGFAIDLAEMMIDNISQIKGQRIRGVAPDDLAMTNDDALGCPSCLVECGFMTNGIEMRYMLDVEYQNAVAEAITKTLCKAYKMEYKEPDDIDIPQVPVDLAKMKSKLQAIVDELSLLVKSL